jgi:3'(2'), 5'-bisphosphate nucleotidase
MVRYEQELQEIITLIQRAGNVVMDVYHSDYDIQLKDDQSPVTQADLLSEKTILNGLQGTSHGIISEEAGILPGTSGLYWVIDPLDGTKDFIQKTDEFSIMIGLLDHNHPLLGVVYAPALDKLWYALEGKGAFVLQKGERKPITVSKEDKLSKYRLVISRNHFRQEDKDVADQLGITSFTKMGSVGIKYAMLAEGNAELCIYTTGFLGLWDCCAPHAILRESGGRIFDRDGNDPVYDLSTKKMTKGFIGTNGKHTDEVLNILKTMSNPPR